jgi:hypothetical protein
LAAGFEEQISMPDLLSKPELLWLAAFHPDLMDTSLKIVELDPDDDPPQNMEEAISKHEKKENLSAEKLKELRAIISMEKEIMSEDTNQSVVVQGLLTSFPKAFKVKKGKGSKHDSNPDKEFDPSNTKASKVKEGLSAAANKAVANVIGQLNNLTKQLKEAKSEDDLLFSPDDLMNEIWTPLVREGIIPDSLVPLAMSQFEKLWAGANELYRKQLKKFTQTQQDKKYQTLEKILDYGGELANVGGDVATGVLACMGAAKQTKDTVSLAFKVAKNGFTLGTSLLAKNMEKASDAVAGILASSVQLGTGNKDMAAMIGNIYKAAATPALAAKHLAASPPDVNAAFACFGKGVCAGFTCFDNSSTNGEWARIGEGVQSGLLTCQQIALITIELKKPKPDMKKVIGFVSAAVEQCVKVGLKNAAIEANKTKTDPLNKELDEVKKALKKTDLSEKEKNDLTEKQNKLQHEIDLWTPDADEPGKVGAALKGIIDNVANRLQDKDKKAEIEKKAAEKAKEAGQEELENVRQQLDKQMKALFADADDKTNEALEELYSIEHLIAQIEADRATFELVKMVIDTTAGVVSQFVPMLGGPLKAKDFAMNVVAAVMRARELKKWKGYINDAKKAVSPTASAFVAEVSEIEAQLTNEILDAAFNLAQACTASAAIAFPAVDGATKVLAAAQTIKTFIYTKVYKPAKLKSAWNKYKAALKQPNNLTLKRKAMKKNPTLAKYAIAYGALEMNDPFAKQALRDCGLTDEVLMHKDTNAEKVYEYLKLKMNEDIVVEGVLNEFVPKAGQPLALKTWNKNKEVAASKHDWKNQGTANIEMALIALEDAEAAAAKNVDSVKLLEKCIVATGNLQVVLSQYKPVTTTGKPHTQFADYVNELAAEAAKKSEKFDKELAEKKEVLQIQMDAQTKRRDQSLLALQELALPIPALGTFTTPKTLEDYCLRGAGQKLTATLKGCATVSFQLQEASGLVEDTFEIAGRKMAKTPPNTEIKVQHDRLTEVVKECVILVNVQKKEADDELLMLNEL